VRGDVGAYKVHLQVTKHTYQSQSILSSHTLNTVFMQYTTQSQYSLHNTAHESYPQVIKVLQNYPQVSNYCARVMHRLSVLYKS
jgi:hypothetical protein